MQSTGRQVSHPNIVLAFLLLAYIFNFLDRTILSILAAPIKADLGLSDTQFGAISGLAFALLYSFLAIPLALLAWFLFRRLATKRPVMLIRGAQSDIITRPIAERMKARARNLTIVDVPGVGHAPTLAEPVATAAIDRFLISVA